MSRKVKREVRVPTANKNPNDDHVLQNKRLKSLYDAIDAGRNKDSIDIAEKIIRKFGAKDRNTPNDRITVNTAQALKALALIRAENTAEAAPLVENCEQALINEDFNEGTLQVLFHCFKESYIPNRIPQLLEKILRNQPASEGLLLDLYFGYARILDFKNQQRVANLLYKDFDKLKYLLWAVNSLIMQAIASPDLAEKMYYPLAQRMLEKIGEKRKLNRTEIVLNYHVLTRRGLFDKAWEYLEANSADGDLNKQDSKRMRVELLKLSKNFEKLLNCVIEDIHADCLDFGAWETLFWTFDQVTGDKEFQKRIITKFDELRREYLPETHEKNYIKHSSFLIRCLFAKRLINAKYDISEFEPCFGELHENLKQILLISHNRLNCFFDVSKFLHLLTNEQKNGLLTFVENELKEEIEKRMTNAMLIREQLRTAFGFYSNEDGREFAISLVNLFHKNAKDDSELDSHAKSVTVIVANIFWRLYRKSGSTLHLFELAALLEFILDRCPKVYITAVLLIRIYIALGNMNRIIALSNQLDIKYFQRDSLGYLTFGSAMQYGRFQEAIYYYTSVTAQFDNNDREIVESIVTANKVCNLDQIPQLVSFSEHCKSSLYAIGVDVLNQLLSACFAVDNLHFAVITLRGDDERIDWNKITDSRDFGILQPIALSDENVTETVKKLSFTETIDFIKLFHGLGRVISDIGVANLPETAFDADFAALRTHLGYCKSAYSKPEVSEYLQGFGAAQLFSLVSKPFLQPIIALLELTSKIFALESNPTAETISKLTSIADDLVANIDFDEISNLCDIKEEMAQFLECGTHYVLVMTLCELIIKFMEARVAVILLKINKNLTFEKIEKSIAQQKSLSEQLEGSLKLNDDQEEMGGRKSKKGSSKNKPFNELNDEQRIVTSFKVAQQKLLGTCKLFEQKVSGVKKELNSTLALYSGSKMAFEDAALERYTKYVCNSLEESYLCSLDKLSVYTGRINFFATLPRFNLLNIHFTGSQK